MIIRLFKGNKRYKPTFLSLLMVITPKDQITGCAKTAVSGNESLTSLNRIKSGLLFPHMLVCKALTCVTII